MISVIARSDRRERPGNLYCARVVATVFALFLGAFLTFASAGAQSSHFSFQQLPDRLEIKICELPIATYVFHDPKILRPYFCSVHARNGTQVTRNHPPVEGNDAMDHADLHPGIFLAFGDISGADFWRNKGYVRHEKFIEEPKCDINTGTFAVSNVYESDGKTICREQCRYTIVYRPEGYFLLHDSEFFNDEAEFIFGDQEEMGLGLRVATPISVKKGGHIINADGLKDEAGAWGKPSLWCDYSGDIDGQQVGITLMPHPDNFRPSWFHARDYGLLVANPFGQNAFTEGQKSAVRVPKGERFRLRFGIFIYAAKETPNLTSVYDQYLKIAAPGTAN
ncbi:MAG: PmoA family protein [Candidatus Hydrogenedentes bacterium]|nr:PmoA family protein [Candidatus Hydrogenedentota bacterium]